MRRDHLRRPRCLHECVREHVEVAVVVMLEHGVLHPGAIAKGLRLAQARELHPRTARLGRAPDAPPARFAARHEHGAVAHDQRAGVVARTRQVRLRAVDLTGTQDTHQLLFLFV